MPKERYVQWVGAVMRTDATGRVSTSVDAASGRSPAIVVGGMLTKAGQDVTLIDRLSQRVQQRALAAQALGTPLGEALNALVLLAQMIRRARRSATSAGL